MAGLIAENTKYGLRPDGTPKGEGYFGALPTASGKVMTEVTIGVKIGGKETNIPLLVPTLTPEEIQVVANLKENESIPKEIVDKAAQFAIQRIQQGKGVYAEDNGIIGGAM